MSNLMIRRDLPTGEPEQDDTRRLAAWCEVQDKAARLLGAKSYGLDPQLTFLGETGHPPLIMLTPEAAVRLAACHDALQKAGLLSKAGVAASGS